MPYISKNTRRRKKPLITHPDCVVGKDCDFHGTVHGAEAEELRQRIQAVLDSAVKLEDDLGYEDEYVRIEDIDKVLNDVDARDSCEFLERHAKTKLQYYSDALRSAQNRITYVTGTGLDVTRTEYFIEALALANNHILKLSLELEGCQRQIRELQKKLQPPVPPPETT